MKVSLREVLMPGNAHEYTATYQGLCWRTFPVVNTFCKQLNAACGTVPHSCTMGIAPQNPAFGAAGIVYCVSGRSITGP